MIAENRIKSLPLIEKVIVHSIEGGLYLVSIVIDGDEQYVANAAGEPIKHHNKLDILRLFDPKKVKEAVLRHESAYDEMVGSTYDKTDNAMEVPISFSQV